MLALNETGRVDLAHMETLFSSPPEEFLPELKGLVYRNPQTEQWETDDQYLSGEVRAKLENARAAAASTRAYQENVSALEAVQPADLTRFGNRRAARRSVDTADRRGGFRPIAPRRGWCDGLARCRGGHVVSERRLQRQGHRREFDRMGHRPVFTALELIQDALNLKTPTVYDARFADEEQRRQRDRNRSRARQDGEDQGAL